MGEALLWLLLLLLLLCCERKGSLEIHDGTLLRTGGRSLHVLSIMLTRSFFCSHRYERKMLKF